MQKRIKERVIGISVIVAVAAIFLPLLFYHPLPGVQGTRLQAEIPPETNEPKLVYDLPLQGTASAEKQQDGDERFDLTTVEELRKKASQTSTISASILHSNLPVAERNAEQLANEINEVNSPKEPKRVSLNTDQMIPTAWVIQLASFAEADRADELTSQLRKEGLDVYVKSSDDKSNSAFRVYVGPYIQYDKIEALQTHLQQQYHLKGVIKKYTV